MLPPKKWERYMESSISRRSVLATLSRTAAAVSPGSIPGPAHAQVSVPWSTGTEKPKYKPPYGATDCHQHIYSSSFKPDPKATIQAPDATVAEYRLLQARLGLTRNVVIQPWPMESIIVASSRFLESSD